MIVNGNEITEIDILEMAFSQIPKEHLLKGYDALSNQIYSAYDATGLSEETLKACDNLTLFNNVVSKL